MQFKARAGYTIAINGSIITLSRSHKGSTTIFQIDEVSEVKANRSVYDLPFLEKTITFYLKSGKKYAVKRLPSKAAQEIQDHVIEALTGK
jgi:hypothetical protein